MVARAAALLTASQEMKLSEAVASGFIRRRYEEQSEEPIERTVMRAQEHEQRLQEQLARYKMNNELEQKGP